MIASKNPYGDMATDVDLTSQFAYTIKSQSISNIEALIRDINKQLGQLYEKATQQRKQSCLNNQFLYQMDTEALNTLKDCFQVKSIKAFIQNKQLIKATSDKYRGHDPWIRSNSWVSICLINSMCYRQNYCINCLTLLACPVWLLPACLWTCFSEISQICCPDCIQKHGQTLADKVLKIYKKYQRKVVAQK